MQILSIFQKDSQRGIMSQSIQFKNAELINIAQNINIPNQSLRKKFDSLVKKINNLRKKNQTIENFIKFTVDRVYPYLEQDSEKTIKKTEEMKKVTKAYQEGNILNLISLAIDNLDDFTLNLDESAIAEQYIHHLEHELKRLRLEQTKIIERPTRLSPIVNPYMDFYSRSEKNVDLKIHEWVDSFAGVVGDYKRLTSMCQTKKGISELLKDYKQYLESAYEDMMFSQMFGEFDFN